MIPLTKTASIQPLKSQHLWTKDVLGLMETNGDPADRSAPRGYKLKPLNADLITGAFERSPTISNSVELYDLAHDLGRKFGPHTVMAIYYGVVNGKKEDLQNLGCPVTTVETIDINGVQLNIEHVIYALLVTVAVTDCIGLVSNRMGMTQAKRWLRRLATALSSRLLAHYVNKIRPLLSAEVTSRPYIQDAETNVHFVSQEFYDKLVKETRLRGKDTEPYAATKKISQERSAANEIIRNTPYYKGDKPRRH